MGPSSGCCTGLLAQRPPIRASAATAAAAASEGGGDSAQHNEFRHARPYGRAAGAAAAPAAAGARDATRARPCGCYAKLRLAPRTRPSFIFVVPKTGVCFENQHRFPRIDFRGCAFPPSHHRNGELLAEQTRTKEAIIKGQGQGWSRFFLAQYCSFLLWLRADSGGGIAQATWSGVLASRGVGVFD